MHDLCLPRNGIKSVSNAACSCLLSGLEGGLICMTFSLPRYSSSGGSGELVWAAIGFLGWKGVHVHDP